jgi:hypothetical protein
MMNHHSLASLEATSVKDQAIHPNSCMRIRRLKKVATLLLTQFTICTLQDLLLDFLTNFKLHISTQAQETNKKKHLFVAVHTLLCPQCMVVGKSQSNFFGFLNPFNQLLVSRLTRFPVEYLFSTV